MRRITIHTTFGLQFDADDVTSGPREHQVEQAIEMINMTLQRQPYGLGAQIMGPHWDDCPEITEEVSCDNCSEWREIGDEDEGCPCGHKEDE